MKYEVKFETFRRMEGHEEPDEFINSIGETIECFSRSQLIAQISLIEEKIRGEAQQIMDAKYNPIAKIGKTILTRMIAVVKFSIKKLE